MSLVQLLERLRGFLAYCLLGALRSLAEVGKRFCNIPCIGEQRAQVQLGAAEFWLQLDRLAILIQRGSSLALRSQKISQQVVRFGHRWIAPQELLYLVLRVFEAPRSRQSQGIVEARSRIVGLHPKSGLEMETRFVELSGRRQHIAQIAVGFRVVRLNSNGFS